MTTLEEMFECLCEHIKYSTNNGAIRPSISVFRQRVPGKKDKFRVWNRQFLSYAGYEQDDGTVIGDKQGVAFTKVFHA